jgi:DNA modification methylase
LEKFQFKICPKCGKPIRPNVGDIIETEPDVILDPMAGVGTTGVEAILLGRHCVMVDIEEKFADLMKKNLKSVEKVFEKSSFKPKLGKAVVITGDSRHLSELLQQHADAILTSPPYSEGEHNYKHGLKTLGDNFKGRKAWEEKRDIHLRDENVAKLKHGEIDTVITSPPYANAISKQGGETTVKNVGVSTITARRYSDNPDNIGNLSEGIIDAVLTSPPYSEALQARADYEKRKERLNKLGHTRKTHGLLRGQKSTSKVIGGNERYSENPQNIGNLQHGQMPDVILTSPPYSESLQTDHDDKEAKILRRAGKQKGKPLGIAKSSLHLPYSENSENIGNLKHGKSVDAILTSPPYSESMTKKRKGYTIIPQLAKTREMPQDTKDENIANLQHGSVDAILTSPPFAESLANENPNRRKGYWKTSGGYQSGHGVETYGENKENIGNLKHDESVDAILTSPPYSESMTKKRKGYTIIPQLAKTREMPQDTRDENIANLSHGNVDAVITSPPYAAMRSRSTDEENLTYTTKRNGKNIGTIMKCGAGDSKTYGEIDTVITSPPYANALNQDHDEQKQKEVSFKTGDPHRGIGKSQVHTIYSNSKENIGNLPHESNVDVILTSPPYAIDPKNVCHTKEGKTLEDYDRKRGFKTTRHPRTGYSPNEKNIGNLPHESNVDVILTSPPYARDKGGEKGMLMHDEKRRKDKTLYKTYGKNPENIDNLPYVDTVITSPPFGSSTLAEGLRGRDLSKQKDFIRKKHRDYGEIGSKGDSRQIGNLPYVDTVITSPPYADIHQCPTNTGLTEFFRKQLEEKGFIEWNGKRYTEAEWRAMNHGRLDGRSTPGVKKDAKYSDNPQNIGNLPFEQVDTILTSPPFAESIYHLRNKPPEFWEELARRTGRKAWLNPNGTTRKTQTAKDNAYSNKENIGNLLHTENVDVILTSPPYQNAVHDTLEKRKKWKEKGMHEAKKGLPVGYSENPENIGNIKEQGEVDAIITSPPYEATFNAKQHTLSGIAKRDPNYRREVGGYGQNEANIGNLRHGKDGVDTVITSPPYHDTKSDWDRKSGDAKKGVVVAYSDEVGRDRKNIGNIHYYDQGEPLSKKYSKADKNKTETYLQAMLKCYQEMFRVLRPGGLCIVVLKNFVRRRKIVDLIGDTERICEFVGFRLVKRIKFRLPTLSFWRINEIKEYEKKTGKPFPMKEFESAFLYETVLVFKKM